jgi:hypothetical protein
VKFTTTVNTNTGTVHNIKTGEVCFNIDSLQLNKTVGSDSVILMDSDLCSHNLAWKLWLVAWNTLLRRMKKTKVNK